MSDLFTTADTRCWSRDDALIVSFQQQPRPTITTDVLDSLERALAEAERNFATLIVASSGQHFAYGANLSDAFDAATSGSPQILDAALKNYQRVMLKVRHSSVPTVAAVQGIAISGGCELLMHCTRVVAHSQSRIGLLEALVGIVPGGGGLKEFALRGASSDDFPQAIVRAFETISAGTLALAADAQRLGFLTAFDVVDANDPLTEAIALGRALNVAGHVVPPMNPSFQVAGPETESEIRSAQAARLGSGELTAHQFEINRRVAQVLCGGDAAGTMRTESEMLALERLHFLALMEMPLTQARIAHIRETGRLLAN